MFKKTMLGLGLAAGTAIGAWSIPAQAGGYYCSADWKPENPDLNCASQIAISPGNDSRINLFLLIQDRAGQDGAGLSYPDVGWDTSFGRNFMRWSYMRAAWFPDPAKKEWPAHSGTRCQTVETGGQLFSTALAKNPPVRPEWRSFLGTTRSAIEDVCNNGAVGNLFASNGKYFQTQADFGGATAKPGAFLAYAEGSMSFYAGDWDRAAKYYTELARMGGDEWVKETSKYMIARNSLNEAIETGEDEWGDYEPDQTNGQIAARAEKEFREYLAEYPAGRYAKSASGLIRKALWLRGEFSALAPIYDDLLQRADPADRSTADLIDEVDDKFLNPRDGQIETRALLLAADDLIRMRTWAGSEEQPDNLISAAELERQAAAFADHPKLYGLLKANHAFYVQGDYRAVLQLLPDAAREESYTPLDFSRQYLRGLALHALKDRNEAGFWLDLIEGSKGIWQRPAVELALARNYEQAGQLDKVFAKGSPITDLRIRRILLDQSAGPDILKAQARSADLPASERSFALFSALIKQLEHGQYSGFVQDLPLTKQFLGSDESGLWSILDAEISPVHIFNKGKFSDGIACPQLETTVRALARNSRNARSRLCLGDFYRLNGFDNFGFGDRYNGGDNSGALGERNFYPGAATPRHDFYTSIMADRTASRDDRAYALYRAIRCYAPANANSCGGDGVDEPVRASWFRRLKRDYGSSKWARELEYYW
ncbi:hypothetical protein GCM10023115_54340 [Pontixanthobacter gangjinensis]|uniref:Tetratricopeptide repeat-containing protein n=1 Tax=Pontixanthobacter gangjinensis TaxID=1028742 RepID=A0A6I4SPG4_9SPHN|nr:hypothetical protein [Pontixanthobacter gangjinensis]MXO57715.1 hypothetical protein [Pontixanthobacter gangjinensis]